MSVANNLVLGYEYQDQYHRGICINYKVLASDAEKKIQEYDIRPADAAVAARTLSGGNQQKVVVARESSRASRLIVADQPTRGVDIGASELIYDVFYQAVAQSKAVFLSSLELDEVMLLSDRIAVIHKGKLVELAESEQLFAHPLHPYTRALLSAIPMPDPASEKGKKLLVYDPSCHDYTQDGPVWSELEPGHFVMGNQRELDAYRKMLL